MDRIWQWAWDRYGGNVLWAMCAIAFFVVLPIYLLASFAVVAFERSGHYVAAAVVTVVAVLVMSYVFILPRDGRLRLAQECTTGHQVDRLTALKDTYAMVGGRFPDWWRPTLFWPPPCWLWSVRSTARRAGGSSNTQFWASSSELPSS